MWGSFSSFLPEQTKQILTFSVFSEGMARSEGLSGSTRNIWTSGGGHTLKTNKETKSVFFFTSVTVCQGDVGPPGPAGIFGAEVRADVVLNCHPKLRPLYC